jgi:hypothetical protein
LEHEWLMIVSEFWQPHQTDRLPPYPTSARIHHLKHLANIAHSDSKPQQTLEKHSCVPTRLALLPLHFLMGGIRHDPNAIGSIIASHGHTRRPSGQQTSAHVMPIPDSSQSRLRLLHEVEHLSRSYPTTKWNKWSIKEWMILKWIGGGDG